MKINLLKICKDLYPIPRSITGIGVVKTLDYLKNYFPLEIKKIKSGKKAFDWTIPPEWNIKSAFIKDVKTGKKIIDLKDHNLHIVGYSSPINQNMTFKQLKGHLHYLEDQPDAIPYVTSYYKKTWGFCLSYNQYKGLNKKSKFDVFIDSELKTNGNLHYGEYIIKGRSNKEIFFSTYICHPQMVNNELSGPAVLTGIINSLMDKTNYYTYRFIFIPETIGSIAYLSINLKSLQKNVVGGYNVSCVGDENNWGLVPSRYGNNISDKIAEHILNHYVDKFNKFSWLDRGSDERQYCAPGVDLPISCITRSKYGEYPEYHTSLDNFNLVTKKGLDESLSIYLKCIEIFEKDIHMPKINVICEPQLGSRGLYPNISTKKSPKLVKNLMNVISYCDGTNSLLEIANYCNIKFEEVYSYFVLLKENDLLEK